jgi:hypothetical protein
MSFSRLSLAAFASAAILVLTSACAPQITTGLPDEPSNEASDSGPDRASDPKQGTNLVDAPSQAAQLPVSTPANQSAILAKYSQLDPDHLIPRTLLATALQYFDDHSSSIQNKNYLSVIDFSLPSTKRRFFIVNMATGAVFATTVAHGKNSDKNNDGFADTFSNTVNSDMSSLGLYLTAETYSGKHGLSLRLDGKSSTNSNVRERAIVVHGADYVQDKEIRQGRSWGCPAVPMAYRDKIIAMIKNGSVIYAGQSLK